MHPEDKLFATLDVTAHPGKLSSGMTVLFIDTVGFVSDLPPQLVESFSATLEDIAVSVSNLSLNDIVFSVYFPIGERQEKIIFIHSYTSIFLSFSPTCIFTET